MFTDWPSLPRTISALFLFREPLIDCTGPARMPETGPGNASRVTGVSMLYEEVIVLCIDLAAAEIAGERNLKHYFLVGSISVIR